MAATELGNTTLMGVIRTFSANLDEAVVVVEPETCRIAFLNQAAEAFLGYPSDQAIGTSVVSLISPDHGRCWVNGSSTLGEEPLLGGHPAKVTVHRKTGEDVAAELTTYVVTAPLDERWGVAILRDLLPRTGVRGPGEPMTLLDEIQQLAHLGSWEWDLISDQATWSDELYRILGLNPQGVTPSFQAFLERVHPDDREVARATLEPVGRPPQPYMYDTRIVRPDGTVRHVRVRGKIVVDTRGQAIRRLGTVQDITAQRQAEEILQQHADLLDLSRDAIYVRDFRTGVISYWSQGAVNVFGWSSDEALGQVAHELLKTAFPISREHVHAQLLQAGRWKGTLVQTAKDGRRILLESRWDLKRDEQGQAASVLVTSTDMTAEKTLQAQFELLVRNLTDYAVYLMDPQGRLQTWNTGAARLKGYQESELVGRHFTCFFTDEDIRDGRPRRLLDQVRTEGSARDEGWLVRKDGTRFWAEQSMSAVRDPLGRLVGIGSVARDLTKRRQFEEELRQSEEKFRSIFERAGIGVAMADAVGNFIEVNPALIKLLGYQSEEMKGQNYLDFTHPADRGYCEVLVRELVAGRSDSFSIEKRFRRKDGSYVLVNSTVVSIPGPDGRPIAILGIIEDITKRKEAERALLRARDELEERVLERTAEIRRLNADLERRVAERTQQLEATNKELEAFSYSVSHDLRAPLRSIDGFSLAVLEDYSDRLDDVGRDYLGRVRAASQRMANLIDDMLQLSRLTRGEMHVGDVDLGAIAAEILQDLRRSAPDRDVEVVIAPGLVTRGDPRLMQSVLENLLGNAWKFTSKHAHARIELGRTVSEGQTAYYVRDDGAGFDTARADRLFKPFSRLHSESEFEGTGIGLATVQRIIHRHGGRIWAEGAVEKGATFYFTLGGAAHDDHQA